MHHSVIDRWSHGRSYLHRRDARVKIIVLLAFLIALAVAPRLPLPVAAACAAALVLAAWSAGLPPVSILLRAAVVLPFAGAFALFTALAGDISRAAALLGKSYFSAIAVLILVTTTPLPKLARGLESLGAPGFLVMLIQFVYRYLFVISEQVQHMRAAAASRGLALAPRKARFRIASAAVGTLFARSYERAEGIHDAMLSRGFHGRTKLLATPSVNRADVAFLAAGMVLCLALGITARLAA